MRGRFLTAAAAAALACVFVVAGQSSAAAQGRGRGGGGGMGRGPSMGGPPPSVGVDRGIGRSSDASAGRSDRGRGTASERSDAGLRHARMRDENSRRADRELREHPEMAARLNTSANDLREGYRAALAANPELEFGQYVAATRLAANLGDRHPAVTRGAILSGLAEGKSIGRTLRDLGLGSQEAGDAERRVKRELKESRRRS